MFLLGILCSVLSLLQGGDATLVFAGDAMQHDRQIEAARRSDGSFDYSAYFRHVADYVSAADYAVVNLECTLGGKPYKGYPCFSAPEEYAVALKDAGFDLFLHANNHCLDRRDAGLRRTLDQLDMLGVPHIGTYRNAAERAKNYPFVADVKGMKIAFLNYTYGTNGITVQGDVVVDYIDRAKIHTDIQAARRKGADLVVACMHWGVEYQLVQNKEQELLADWLVDEGVDLVIGGHPHVIQPMQMRRAKDGRQVLVVYSMGNFISGMRKPDTRGGAMVRVKVGWQNGKPVVKSAGYKLVFVQDPDKSVPNYSLVPADREWLVRADQRSFFDAFCSSARKIFNRYNNGSEEQFWLSVFNAKPTISDRKSSQSSIFIKRPYISVVGTIQQKILGELGKGERASNGFIDRILFVMPQSVQKSRWSDRETPEELEQEWQRIINRLIEQECEFNEQGELQSHHLPFREAAKRELYAWQHDNARKCDLESNEALLGIYCKLEIYIIRFALIIQLARWTCGECDKEAIDIESVRRAIELVEYFRTTAIRVQTSIGNEQLNELHRTIYHHLPQRFTTAEGIALAESYGMKEHAFKMMLKRHLGTLFKKINHGEYSK